MKDRLAIGIVRGMHDKAMEDAQLHPYGSPEAERAYGYAHGLAVALGAMGSRRDGTSASEGPDDDDDGCDDDDDDDAAWDRPFHEILDAADPNYPGVQRVPHDSDDLPF